MKWVDYQLELASKNMKLNSGNQGFLKPEDVTVGDKVVMYSEPKENEFSFTNDKGEIIEGMDWRVKVLLPNGTKKMAIISSFSHDAILSAYGDDTKDYVGHSLECGISKWGKLTFKPTSDPKVVFENADKPLTDEQKAGIQAARGRELAGREAANAPLDPTNQPPF